MGEDGHHHAIEWQVGKGEGVHQDGEGPAEAFALRGPWADGDGELGLAMVEVAEIGVPYQFSVEKQEKRDATFGEEVGVVLFYLGGGHVNRIAHHVAIMAIVEKIRQGGGVASDLRSGWSNGQEPSVRKRPFEGGGRDSHAPAV